MSTVLEYPEYPSYNETEQCLDEREAVERYQAEKSRNPNALIVLEELHCGEHWRVKVYETRSEKDNFLREWIRRIFDCFADRVDTIIVK